jgi:hypothetical protein
MYFSRQSNVYSIVECKKSQQHRQICDFGLSFLPSFIIATWKEMSTMHFCRLPISIIDDGSKGLQAALKC